MGKWLCCVLTRQIASDKIHIKFKALTLKHLQQTIDTLTNLNILLETHLCITDKKHILHLQITLRKRRINNAKVC